MKSILLTTLLFSFQADGFAQIKRITLTLKDSPIETAFSEITRQTGEVFFYSSDMLRDTRPVNVKMVRASLQDVLKHLFDGQPLAYAIVNKTVVITEKKPVPSRSDSVKTIRGIVSADGTLLEGVSVTIAHATLGTTTNSKGEFQLHDVPLAAALLFSAIGYQPKTVAVTRDLFYQVTLEPAVNTLHETIVIGYGRTSKKRNTGAVSKINAKDISTQPINNALAAISGRMAGVNVIQRTGVPGGSFSIQIRGRNSLRNEGNNPLYIIDGVPVSSSLSSTILSGAITQGGHPLNMLNPSDIERIDILKDGDATAIYGSRGANGVVLITTKKAKSGKGALSLQYQEGVGSVTRLAPLLNTEQYLAMRQEAFANDGIEPGPEDYDINGTWKTDRQTDWQKVLLGHTTRRSNASASFEGGTLQTKVLLTGTYNKESSVFPCDAANERITGHANISHQSTDSKFKLQFTTMAAIERNRLPQLDLMYYANTLSPNAPAPFTEDGKLNWENSTWDNPMAELQRIYQSDGNNLLGNLVLSYSPFRGLQFKTSLGYSRSAINEIAATPTTSLRPAYEVISGSALYSDANANSWIAEPEVSYTLQKGNHHFSWLVGATLQQSRAATQTFAGSGYVSDLQLRNMQAAADIDVIAREENVYRYVGLFSRIGYDFDNKYFINLTGRRDGSSRFSPSRQFGNFGAIGAAWLFSEEPFFAALPELFSFGKLRMSYGTTGSDQIGDYQFLHTYAPTPYPYQQQPGFIPTRLHNLDFRWEINKKWEAAIELGFFDDRLLASVGHYRNTSSNQLVGYFLAPTAGFRSIQANLPATVLNYGTEIELSATIVNATHFTWTTSANLTVPSSRLVSFPNIATSSYANTYTVGEPLITKKAIHFAGIDNNGIYIFEDYNNNGKQGDNPGDLRPTKKLGQLAFGGWQQNVVYKQFTFDLHLQWVQQNGYNYLTAFNTAPGGFSNQPTYVMKRWQKQGDDAEVQQFTAGANAAAIAAYRTLYSLSDARISNASFVRLKNISVAYSFKKLLSKQTAIKELRLSLQAQNLFTITQFQGNDPENHESNSLPPLRMITTSILLNF